MADDDSENHEIEPLEVDGAQPAIEGMECQAIVAQQYWRGGVLDEAVNVAHLRFGDAWHRLYFDCGIVFWRRSDEAPFAFDAPEIDADYRLHDIGAAELLVGRTLLSIEAMPHVRGSRVAFTFSGGTTLTFTCTDDRTTYDCR